MLYLLNVLTFKFFDLTQNQRFFYIIVVHYSSALEQENLYVYTLFQTL